MKEKIKDCPLDYSISEDGIVSIKIDVSRLATLTKECLEDTNQWPEEIFRLTEERGFAEDMIREIFREREDGSTKLTDLFNWSAIEAIEQGSEHVEYKPRKKRRNQPKT